jgi:hypothetical protein
MAKSISIKGTERRFGGCALKVVELTSGELSSVAGSRERRKPTERAEQSELKRRQQSAAGVVGEGNEPRGSGGLTAPKAQTERGE